MVDESLIPVAAPPGADPPAPQDAANPANNIPLPDNGNVTEQLQKEFTELKRAFAEFTSQHIPGIDQIRQDLAAAAAERDSANGELRRLKRQNCLNDLAGKHGFCDVEYLDFVLDKHNIELEDTEKVNEFMQQLRQNNPRNFVLPLQPGAGSRPGALPEKRKYPSAGTSRMDAVELMLSGAPEIY